MKIYMTIIELNAGEHSDNNYFYHLTDAQLRSRQEPEKGMFIAEGPKVVHAALDAGYEPLSLLMRKKFVGDKQGISILARCPQVPVYTGTDEALSDITGFRLERSWVLCAMRRPKPQMPEEVLKEASRIAVLEGITEPSNVGAIFRSAAALSVDGILLSPNCCDPFHRRAVRVCMGAVMRIPWARLHTMTPFELLRQNGFTTVGLALTKDSIPLDAPDLLKYEKLALFLGTEDTGLCEETIASCDYSAIIPMARGIDSLNVGAAAAIAFWQFRKR